MHVTALPLLDNNTCFVIPKQMEKVFDLCSARICFTIKIQFNSQCHLRIPKMFSLINFQHLLASNRITFLPKSVHRMLRIVISIFLVRFVGLAWEIFKYLGHKNQPQRSRNPASVFAEVALVVLTPVCECIDAQKLLRPLEESFEYTANYSHIAFDLVAPDVCSRIQTNSHVSMLTNNGPQTMNGWLNAKQSANFCIWMGTEE